MRWAAALPRAPRDNRLNDAPRQLREGLSVGRDRRSP